MDEISATKNTNDEDCSSCTDSHIVTGSHVEPAPQTIEAQKTAEANAAAIGEHLKTEEEQAQAEAAGEPVPEKENIVYQGDPTALYASTTLESTTVNSDLEQLVGVPLPQEEVDMPSDPELVAVPLVPEDAPPLQRQEGVDYGSSDEPNPEKQ